MASLQDAAKLKELESTYGLTPDQAQKALDIAKTEGTGFADAAQKARKPAGLKDKVLGAKLPQTEPIPIPETSLAPAITPEGKDKQKTLNLMDTLKTPKATPEAVPTVAPASTVQQRVEDKKLIADTVKTIRGQGKQEDVKPVDFVASSLASIDKAVGGVDKVYAPKLEAIANQIQAKEKDITSAEEKKAWLGLASQLASALTQYGAARYGMKHGVDMSGLKVEPANLEAAMGYQFSKLNKELEKLEKEKAGTEAAAASERADLAKTREKFLTEEQKKKALEDERAFKAGESEKDREFTAEEKQKERDFRLALETGKTNQRVAEQAAKSVEKSAVKNKFPKDKSAAAGFALRAEQAEEALKGIRDLGYRRESTSGALESLLPGSLQSDISRQQDQAEMNFVTAILRPESGAAISEEEYAREVKKYFPRAGDGPETINQKKQARNAAISTVKAMAGEAYQFAADEYKKLTGKPIATEQTKSINGKTYKKVEGGWQLVK